MLAATYCPLDEIDEGRWTLPASTCICRSSWLHSLGAATRPAFLGPVDVPGIPGSCRRGHLKTLGQPLVNPTPDFHRNAGRMIIVIMRRPLSAKTVIFGSGLSSPAPGHPFPGSGQLIPIAYLSQFNSRSSTVFIIIRTHVRHSLFPLLRT